MFLVSPDVFLEQLQKRNLKMEHMARTANKKHEDGEYLRLWRESLKALGESN